MYQVLSALHIFIQSSHLLLYVTIFTLVSHIHEKTEVEWLNAFVRCHLAGKLVQWDQSQGSQTSAPALTLATTMHLSQAMRYFS